MSRVSGGCSGQAAKTSRDLAPNLCLFFVGDGECQSHGLG